MGWQGDLALAYRRQGERTVVHDRHSGPLRMLRSLYPEAGKVCHTVLVHPPGGIVGGDTLAVSVDIDAGAHALITTPGATRFYRSAGAAASQAAVARVAAGARLEWLPLESIAYSGCLAANILRCELAPGAEMFGWDVTALGLPASAQPFALGRFTQSIEIAGRWLERGTVEGDDARPRTSPLVWAGQAVLATLWFAAGSAIEPNRREALLAAARTLAGESPLRAIAGATSTCAEVVVLRALAPRVEPAMQLLQSVWAAWRQEAWQLAPCRPRVWQT